ncbi:MULTISPECIES: NADH-quinone oxidoreductase subunit N [Duncaniella]|jgi:NADH-quinone oxidoreductase subunit N|nr:MULTISPECIES: NADH-quinone oxidoreductase subunit N [Duncaniella]NBH92281.1 NADH-quinone oxidoreductase subunit N [Muribaculaceae bacterium S4]NBI20738.1 NADH-quinone oxidoreductase subunit N [Muribaculaceae bacterium Z1]ROS87112.1 NADH-quinone oxidoreductase subunit N [Muribaculaceae bacterium Isolate-039 (Harlan)]ROT00268.1 NADH-quinone oxidoreductase subunit N [Muribaculaceae bacterium Isolate-083 (Janvier)]ROT00359.1 NADH-quinone oxidoreductase subunit N [Muribaculaceae bacterium Isolat
MDYSQFLALKQEIGLLIVFLLVFLYDTFCSPRSAKAVPMIATVLMGVLVAWGFCPVVKAPETAFAGMYVTSPVMVAIKNILNVGVFIVLIQSVKWANSEFTAVRRGEFYELILLTLLGMYLMISSRHFLMFIIGLETASLPLCALVAFDKHRYESHEAAIKYVLTAVFSSAILLMGLSFVYGLAGTLYYDGITGALAGRMGVMLSVALAFVMAGFGFKLSLVPFHLWTADVYQGAPTSVTSYLSVISKGSAAFAFLVVLTQVFGQFYAQAWEWMLYALIILTITVGNLFAIRQTNMKRFLAFSSISQAGYIMLAIIGDNNMGVSALMFYTLVYVFSNLAAFGVIGAIENATGKVDMTDYNGLYKTNPRLSFTMMLAMFSLAGIPPFAGFFSKFFVFTAALNGTASAALYVLVLIALINTIISLYYYLLVVKAMFINESDSPIATFRSACSERLGMWICVAGIIGLGIVSYFYDYLLTVVA